MRSLAPFTLLVSAAVALLSCRCLAYQNVTLGWQASTDPSVVGYDLYYGTVSGQYNHKIPITSGTSVTVSNLIEGVTYYFVVTAYSSSGLESVPSNEVSYTVPGVRLMIARRPGGAIAVTSTGVVPFGWVLEQSTNLSTWSAVVIGTNSLVDALFSNRNAPQLFFRLKKATYKAPAVRLMIAHQPGGNVAITSTGVVPFGWVLEKSANLSTWSVVSRGTNSVVSATVSTTSAPQLFFRIKNQ